MRVVIGSGKNRHSFEVPRDKDAREQMSQDIIRILFKQ